MYHCMEHPTQEPLNILRYLSIISKSILSPEKREEKKRHGSFTVPEGIFSTSIRLNIQLEPSC